MTKRMTMQEKFAAKRWYMVGAYQAGATEKAISDMVGLSPASVHNVITQFKKTGSPIRKRLSLAEKRIKHDYDNYGRITNSEDELEARNSKQTTPIESEKTKKTNHKGFNPLCVSESKP
ncbi:hypothetical protein CU098_011232 [Rhizopus stolonifer]|uniref:Uncharacterized protein n=1 Tax=Rhizopus stolonifer TaxID=4846 RepID=A0A367K8Z9_RHIST|nr:hypothetical protein CU098_011232 [Rhizopus stolonifer]